MKKLPLIAVVVTTGVAIVGITGPPIVQGIAIGVLSVLVVVGFLVYRSLRRLGGK